MFFLTISVVVPTNYFIHSSLIIVKGINFRNNRFSIQSVVPIDPLLSNLNFSINQIYHHDGIAYDYYSKNEIGQSKASYHWKIWPLPNEINENLVNDQIEISPFVTSKLPFVDAIYVVSLPHLTERHDNIRKAFHHQGIPFESIEWRMKWNKTTCNSHSNHPYIYQRLNLKDKPLNKVEQRYCPITAEHVDIWYDMAEQNVQLGLILEDDAIFVPFFKEKLTRMIYEAIRSGILNLNGTCVKFKDESRSKTKRTDQNPMIVIGTCHNWHGHYFQKHLPNFSPLLSTHKSHASRCSHAYLLTSCSAQALIDQMHAQKNDLLASDTLQTYLFRLSPTLQSFWMDPALVYQGNKMRDVIDLDKMPLFRKQTYK